LIEYLGGNPSLINEVSDEIQEIKEPGPNGIVSTFDYSSLVQNSNETTGFKSDLLQELNNEFNTEEQSIFVNSFYSYLNHHPTEDFVVDLDIVCKFIGFANKGNLKKLLLKNFNQGTDYQILLFPREKQVHGGHNSETIMLNVDTFKGLCMLARTEQAKIIRAYYIKLESIIMKVIKKTRQIQPVQNLSNFNQDQINNSKRLLENFGDKNNVMYNVMFNHKNFGFLSKIGIVRELRVFYERFKEHQREFGEVYIHSVIQCTNIDQVERDFKDTNLFQTNRVNVPKKCGKGNHEEIIQLSELVTSETISNEIKKVANDRILDPPLVYFQQPLQQSNIQVDSLEIEKEKTKQIEAQEITKREQIQADKEIRLAQIQSDKEIELEKIKLSNNQPITSINNQQQIPDEPTQEIPREPRQSSQTISANQEENIELVKKFINIKTQFSQNRKDYIFIEQLFIRFIEWFHSIYPNTASPLSQTQMSRCIARLPEFIVMRIAIGPRVNNATPRKVGLVNRKWIN